MKGSSAPAGAAGRVRLAAARGAAGAAASAASGADEEELRDETEEGGSSGSGEESSDAEMAELAVDAEGAAQAAREDKEERELINVEFEFCDPRPVDFHSLKALMSKSAWALSHGLSPLTETIVAQASVGTVVKVSDDVDAYGFVTLLSAGRLRDLEPFKFMKALLLGKCPAAHRQRLEALFSASEAAMSGPLGASPQQLGVLVSERMLNLPPQLVPPMHEALLGDVDWAVDNEIDDTHRRQFRIAHVLVIAPCLAASAAELGAAGLSAGGGGGGGAKGKKRAKAEARAAAAAGGASAASPAELFYFTKFEDELFYNASAFSFSFTDTVPGHEAPSQWCAMVLPIDKFRAACGTIQSMIA